MGAATTVGLGHAHAYPLDDDVVYLVSGYEPPVDVHWRRIARPEDRRRNNDAIAVASATTDINVFTPEITKASRVHKHNVVEWNVGQVPTTDRLIKNVARWGRLPSRGCAGGRPRLKRLISDIRVARQDHICVRTHRKLASLFRWNSLASRSSKSAHIVTIKTG